VAGRHLSPYVTPPPSQFMAATMIDHPNRIEAENDSMA
jgi:hypothetical protein